MQNLEVLPLVLVDALDLHVEERVGVAAKAQLPLQLVGQRLLALALDAAPVGAEFGILDVALEFA